MGIFSRMADIVNSNIVSMLDKAENPEKMVRLMIQEMEDTLVEIKSQTAKIIAEKKTLERKQAHLVDDINKWQEKAELAISKERDDLAKLALEEKAKKEELIENFTRDLEIVEDSLSKYRDDIMQLEKKLKDARKRQREIQLRHQTVTSQKGVRSKIKKADSHEAFRKFEAMESRIDYMESEIEVEDLNKEQTLEEQFATLENESKIEKELETLKKKVKGTEEGENA